MEGVNYCQEDLIQGVDEHKMTLQHLQLHQIKKEYQDEIGKID